MSIWEARRQRMKELERMKEQTEREQRREEKEEDREPPSHSALSEIRQSQHHREHMEREQREQEKEKMENREREQEELRRQRQEKKQRMQERIDALKRRRELFNDSINKIDEIFSYIASRETTADILEDLTKLLILVRENKDTIWKLDEEELEPITSRLIKLVEILKENPYFRFNFNDPVDTVTSHEIQDITKEIFDSLNINIPIEIEMDTDADLALAEELHRTFEEERLQRPVQPYFDQQFNFQSDFDQQFDFQPDFNEPYHYRSPIRSPIRPRSPVRPRSPIRQRSPVRPRSPIRQRSPVRPRLPIRNESTSYGSPSRGRSLRGREYEGEYEEGYLHPIRESDDLTRFISTLPSGEDRSGPAFVAESSLRERERSSSPISISREIEQMRRQRQWENTRRPSESVVFPRGSNIPSIPPLSRDSNAVRPPYIPRPRPPY
jgi:hypothetical protein